MTLDAASAAAGAVVPATMQPAVELTVITQSDDLLLQLGPALGGQAAVRPVESLDEAFAPRTGRRRARLIALDARDPEAARQAMSAAASRAADAVLLVFAPESGLSQFSAALRDTPVFALLSTPLDEPTVHATFERAVAAAVAKAAQYQAGTLEKTAAPRTTPATGDSRAQVTAAAGRRRWGRAAGAILIAILAAGAYRYFAGSGARVAGLVPPVPTRPPAESAPSIDLTVVQGRLEDLLEKARTAMRVRRYTDPPQDNALLFYRSALAADPSSAEARDGLRRVAGVLSERFETAIGAGHLSGATVALAEFAAAAPEATRLANDRARLAAAEAARQRVQFVRRQAEADAQRLADLAAAQGAALARERAATLAKSAAAAATAARSAQLARAHLAARALARTPVKAPVSAAAAAQPVALASRLKLVRNFQPRYPAAALDEGVGGSIVVRFTVDPRGRTRGIRVVKSTPPGVFDRSAVDAVERWRYAPVLIGGKAVAVPTDILIRFDPPQ
ncbi:MAG TPA: energy transducer TonB [Steroidobacteraceae bacterium]|nr:energy transducer TonB [Steroidobacteraceae bacterium]